MHCRRRALDRDFHGRAPWPSILVRKIKSTASPRLLASTAITAGNRLLPGSNLTMALLLSVEAGAISNCHR